MMFSVEKLGVVQRSHFSHVAERLKTLHGIDCDETLYRQIARWTRQREENAGRVRYVCSIDNSRSLWAVKLGSVFVPIVCHCIHRAPIDVLPITAFDRYAPTLRYESGPARAAFIATREAMRRNYEMSLTIAAYRHFCDLCRSGRSEALKYRIQGHLVHRIRKSGGEPMGFPQTLYFLWSGDQRLIVGAPSRRLVESFTHQLS